MQGRILALLLQKQGSPVRELGSVLKNCAVRTCQASACQEPFGLLQEEEAPHLVFTDAELPDGTWTDVADQAEKAGAAINVIVVVRLSDLSDPKLHATAIERGTFQFITPTFTAQDLIRVVRRTAENVISRRDT